MSSSPEQGILSQGEGRAVVTDLLQAAREGDLLSCLEAGDEVYRREVIYMLRCVLSGGGMGNRVGTAEQVLVCGLARPLPSLSCSHMASPNPHVALPPINYSTTARSWNPRRAPVGRGLPLWMHSEPPVPRRFGSSLRGGSVSGHRPSQTSWMLATLRSVERQRAMVVDHLSCWPREI